MKHSSAPTRAEFIEMTEAIKRDQTLRDAAPDLLEACKQSLGFLQLITRMDGFIYLDSESGEPIRPESLWVSLESAIAKAEGK